MGNSVRVTYTRAVTNKHEDGSFDKTELGGDLVLDIGEDADPELASAAFNAVFDELKTQVDAKLADVSVAPVTAKQTDTNGSEAPEEKPAAKSSLDKWVKDSVDKNTTQIRDRVQPAGKPSAAKTIPGEKFSKGPPKEAVKVTTADINEGEAVAFDGVKVFHDNSQTKIGLTQRKTKFGMLRLGKRGEIPGDYVTGKSFDPDVVPQIEAILGDEENGVEPVQTVDVYGYFEARNNDPDVFDLIIQGVAPAS